jgi:hypothetical protein
MATLTGSRNNTRRFMAWASSVEAQAHANTGGCFLWNREEQTGHLFLPRFLIDTSSLNT